MQTEALAAGPDEILNEHLQMQTENILSALEEIRAQAFEAQNKIAESEAAALSPAEENGTEVSEGAVEASESAAEVSEGAAEVYESGTDNICDSEDLETSKNETGEVFENEEIESENETDSNFETEKITAELKIAAQTVSIFIPEGFDFVASTKGIFSNGEFCAAGPTMEMAKPWSQFMAREEDKQAYRQAMSEVMKHGWGIQEFPPNGRGEQSIICYHFESRTAVTCIKKIDKENPAHKQADINGENKKALWLSRESINQNETENFDEEGYEFGAEPAAAFAGETAVEAIGSASRRISMREENPHLENPHLYARAESSHKYAESPHIYMSEPAAQEYRKIIAETGISLNGVELDDSQPAAFQPAAPESAAAKSAASEYPASPPQERVIIFKTGTAGDQNGTAQAGTGADMHLDGQASAKAA